MESPLKKARTTDAGGSVAVSSAASPASASSSKSGGAAKLGANSGAPDWINWCNGAADSSLRGSATSTPPPMSRERRLLMRFAATCPAGFEMVVADEVTEMLGGLKLDTERLGNTVASPSSASASSVSASSSASSSSSYLSPARRVLSNLTLERPPYFQPSSGVVFFGAYLGGSGGSPSTRARTSVIGDMVAGLRGLRSVDSLYAVAGAALLTFKYNPSLATRTKVKIPGDNAVKSADLDVLAAAARRSPGWTDALDIWRSSFIPEIHGTLASEAALLQGPPRSAAFAPDGTPISFRVSGERTGNHSFRSPDMCGYVGHKLIADFGWAVDLKNFNLEVFTMVNEATAWFGINLCTHKPMWKRHRSETANTSLRPTIAYGMLRVALQHIRLSSSSTRQTLTLLDPMCGTGQIPIEAADAARASALGRSSRLHIVGGDIDGDVLKNAIANARECGTIHEIDFLNWNVERLPLLPGEIDICVSDIPFGRRSLSFKQNQKLYPRMFREMTRITRAAGIVAVLTLEKSLMKVVLRDNPYWESVAAHPVDCNGAAVTLFVLRRTSAMLEENRALMTKSMERGLKEIQIELRRAVVDPKRSAAAARPNERSQITSSAPAAFSDAIERSGSLNDVRGRQKVSHETQ